MLFTIPYASVLLVASVSCIWATPIAVNRDIGSLEARGLGLNSLSARGDVHAIHRRAGRGTPHQPKGVTGFTFLTWVRPTEQNKRVEERKRVVSQVKEFLKDALPHVRDAFPRAEIPINIDIPTGEIETSWMALSKQDTAVRPAIVEFAFMLGNNPHVRYRGVLSNPVGVTVQEGEGDSRTPENRGMLYMDRPRTAPGERLTYEWHRIYPAAPNSLMPGGKLAALNPGYDPLHTGNWITDFTFTKKVIPDKPTKDEDIARLAQALLAYALPDLEVFASHMIHPIKDIEFTFRLQEAGKGVKYQGILKNPWESLEVLEKALSEGTALETALQGSKLYREKQRVYPKPSNNIGKKRVAGANSHSNVKSPVVVEGQHKGGIREAGADAESQRDVKPKRPAGSHPDVNSPKRIALDPRSAV
ncbi:hypothetical protein BDP27DRAFT_1404640 [Rhodocollybia butyracea]|uniref:Uncharacterized protein n=1 Tax=Rhodocollybia butyracea TaxID=206335 RepID=A0A9P5PMD5_9AGAR|nr:hypothetical protein BDP27DRAFT_1404640 [Rhodocollybia butyracea]